MRLRGKMLVMLAILGLLGGAAWWQRKPFLARYYVSQLEKAIDDQRDNWVADVVALDDAAIPSLLTVLESADKKACENLEFALVGLVQNWGAHDARSLTLLEELTSRFGAMNVFAKNTALQIPIMLFKKSPGKGLPPSELIHQAGELLTGALNNPELRVATLQLAGALVEYGPRQQWLDQCRGLAVDGLAATDTETRVAAIQLVLRPPLRQEQALLAKIVPFLKDASPRVRKAALIALGPAPDLVSDDDLLPFLHDVDDEVQTMCELALRSRGLQESHILLARYISDERPQVRLQVFQYLREVTDLEPGVWLRRLCEDPAPAIRAAAVRAAVAQSQADMRDCLIDMARQDPSDTVRWLAGYYLTRYQPAVGE